MDDKTNNERGITMLPMSAIEINNGQLKGLPKNPRLIKNVKYDKLKESITNYPEMLSWRSLLVYPLDNGKYIIVGGNMRYRAMEELGHKEAPVFIIPKETPIEKIKAYTILDNNGFGEWDWDLLANEWETFELDDWGVDLPAFDESPTDDEDGDEGNVAEDDFDEDKDGVEPRTNKGDIWVLGEHRLMCGDSSNAADVALLMNGEKADMVFTDPPYGVDYKGINNDSREGLEGLLDKAFFNLKQNCKPGAVFYCFHSDRCADIFHKIYRKYCHFSSMVIWRKNSLVLSQTDYQSIHEPCMYGWFDNGTHQYFGDRKQESVWEEKKESVLGHTTPKPVSLIGKAIKNSSIKNQLIIDVFGGSGSTLIAAEQKGRKARLMELDPHYCDVIVARWEKLTGKKAVKVE